VIHILQRRCPALRALQLGEDVPGSLGMEPGDDRRLITVRILCAHTSVRTTLRSVVKTVWPLATVWVDEKTARQGWNVLQIKRVSAEIRSNDRR